jgi:hypothetical protein
MLTLSSDSVTIVFFVMTSFYWRPHFRCGPSKVWGLSSGCKEEYPKTADCEGVGDRQVKIRVSSEMECGLR